jgi:hypothetical protein
LGDNLCLRDILFNIFSLLDPVARLKRGSAKPLSKRCSNISSGITKLQLSISNWWKFCDTSSQKSSTTSVRTFLLSRRFCLLSSKFLSFFMNPISGISASRILPSTDHISSSERWGSPFSNLLIFLNCSGFTKRVSIWP